MENSAPRLFYLAQELRAPLPAALVKYLPQGEIIQALASFGLAGVEVGLGLSRAQLEKLIKAGAKDGKATREEWKYLISNLITEALIEQKDSMKISEFMGRSDLLSKYINGGASLIVSEEGGFTDDGVDIAKWQSGFTPFDMIFEGFYQGLFMILGSTGTGKTSHLLSLAGMFRKLNLADEIWFYQTEIPQAMFKYRMKPMVQKVKFKPGKDRIFYGLQSFAEIIETLKSNPNPNRIVFHDSPDVLAASQDDGRRFELESLFRDLVVMKSLCKAVFVTSQVRRKDRTVKVTSASESWAKAWYADGMIGIQKMGFRGTNALMKANVVKNRFGPVDFEIQYEYDMISLEGHLNSKSKKRVSGWTDEEDEDTEEGW